MTFDEASVEELALPLPDFFRPMGELNAALVIVWACRMEWSHKEIAATQPGARVKSVDHAITDLTYRVGVASREARVMLRRAIDQQDGLTTAQRAEQMHAHLFAGWRGHRPWPNAA